MIPASSNYEVADEFIYIRSPILGKESEEESFHFIKKNGQTLYGYLVVELSRDQALYDQQSALVAIVAIILASAAFTSIFANVFIKNLVSPIETLNHAAKDIAEGKVKLKVLTPMMGELDHLREGINQIAKEVYNANERAEHNISEYTQELQQTVEQLEI
jgi:two-component system sensor histidine kinase BarA